MTLTDDRSLTLFFVADEKFSMPLAVTLTSCLRNVSNIDRIALHLLDGGLSESSRRRLEHLARRHCPRGVELEVHWPHVPDKWLPDLTHYVFRNTNFNQTVFYRYAIPKLVPESCSRAVYLDSDLVVQCNIAELQDAVADDVSVVAVRDYSIPTYEQRFNGKRVGDWLPYTPQQRYFNSGVLAINVDYWRAHDVHENACRTLSDHPDTCRWPGQDPLNFTLRGTWREMDLGWNLQTGGPDRIRRLGGSETEFLGEPYEQIRKRAKIIHFTGNKPWEQGFTNPDRPAFFEALRRSGWYGPIGYRRWQARWWAKLVKRQLDKKLAQRRQAAAPAVAAKKESGT